MAIVVARIDERLVHGQIVYSWSVAYIVDTIMVVDDVCAKDEMQKMLIRMAVPKERKSKFFNVDDAIQYLKENKDSKEKIFLVAKSPDVYLRLVEEGVELKSINVGGMYFKVSRKQLAKTVYLNEQEVQTFKKLQALGVKSEIRTSPNDKSIDLYGLC